jgi:arylsulfatase A-like enzyme/tetratricopeptide (TPR) repeat protein
MRSALATGMSITEMSPAGRLMRRFTLAALGASALVFGGCGQNSKSPAARPDILLVTIDTLRADAVGFMGGPEGVTPALDRLATTGRVFEFAHAHNVVTLPSHANILTGLLPYQHGVRANSGFTLGDDIPTLAELLSRAGYATAAFVAAYPLDSRFGLDRGFELYDDNYSEPSGVRTFLYAERSGDEVVEAAHSWWTSETDRPRFAWVHLFDPHYPYEPPSPFSARFPSRPYLGEVAAVDAALARMIEPLSRTDTERPAFIAVTSDHGEALGDHGEETHGLFAYESTLKVPLLLWGPGVEPGRDDRSAGHVDLMPTLLAAAGVELPEDMSLAGRSLLDPAPADEELYFEALTTTLTNGWAPLRGVLVGREKYIDLPLPELYDLASDPQEESNLVETRPQRKVQLLERLPVESVWPPEAGETTLEDEARLRSLGYLTGRSSSKTEYGPEDDPKNLLDLDNSLQRMVAAYASGDLDEAASLAREVVGKRPETPVAYSMLAQVLLDRGRLSEAVTFMQAARQEGLATDALERQLALTLVEIGRPEEAIAIVTPLLERAAGGAEPEDLVTYGLALSATGRQAEAADALSRSLAIDETSTRALEAAALVAVRREKYSAAEALALRALGLNDGLPTSWNLLGIALYSSGKEGAVEAWKRCVELDPRQFDALFNLGMVGAELGRPEEAREALEQFLSSAPPARYAEDLELARETLAALRK